MTEKIASAGPRETPAAKRLDGPVTAGWREGTLTRANELRAQCEWILAAGPEKNSDVLAAALFDHLDAARQAATAPSRKLFWVFRHGSLIERAQSNLHAAEANLLHIAPPSYLLGQIPS